MSKSKRALGYARVSSAEQALGSSLRDQQETIKEYARAHGINEVAFFVEAESAIREKIECREQVQALMREVRAGDLVLVAKLDRWSRDPEFTYASTRKILASGASFYAIDDGCDPSTPNGDTELGFRILFAREEHKRIRQRMIGTRNLLCDRGYYAAGNVPYGYMRGKPKGFRGVEKNVLVIVPERAERIRQIFRLYLEGRSMAQIARIVDDRPDQIERILNCRTYVGDVRNSRGEWIRGQHEAIIDAETFVRVRELAATRRKGGPRPRGAITSTSSWFLRNVAHCGVCGGRMRVCFRGSVAEARPHYYRCPKRCGAHSVRVKVVEESFTPIVLVHLDNLREELAREPERTSKPDGPNIDEQRARIARKRARYLEVFADETMTREELHKALGKLDVEVLKIDAAEAARNREAKHQDVTIRRELLRDVTALRTAWQYAEPLERRKIVEQLTDDVRIVLSEVPSPRWFPLEELVRDRG
ncbi:MAG: recombinase family protein [Polyangiaceae bacterium]|nr:recombinase family protein [Polyangiaceae bacterium]